MSATARGLLTALAVVVALGGLSRTIERSHEAEFQRAINIARTTRLASRNDARIDVWFREVKAGHVLSWQPGDRGLFEADVPLILQIEGPQLAGRYPFTVILESRSLRPADPSSQRLLSSVRTWALNR